MRTKMPKLLRCLLAAAIAAVATWVLRMVVDDDEDVLIELP
ncbi:MAG TPA: hypothetical protein VKA84_21960 [Gemmatimonadaceae bacterium]|nr:hypothetical protein [Gemmatimonadaceae bacterium]